MRIFSRFMSAIAMLAPSIPVIPPELISKVSSKRRHESNGIIRRISKKQMRSDFRAKARGAKSFKGMR